MKRRILFIISDTGGGHRSAANAIAAELGDDAECRLVDLLRSSGLPGIRNAPELYGFFSSGHIWLHNLLFRLSNSMAIMNGLSDFLYKLARKRVKKLVEDFPPDIVVVIHPLAVRPMCAFRDETGARWPVVTVVTDLISIHASWLSPQSNLYLMPTREAVNLAIKEGIPQEKLFLSGFPIHPRFLNSPLDCSTAKKQLGIDPAHFTILMVSGGAGGGRVAELVAEVEMGCPECTLLVVTGRNKILRKQLSQRTPLPSQTHVYGFVDNMDLLMAASDVVVTKAGPGTIMEAAAYSRRLILTGAVGLQEAGNIDFVLDNGLGVYCPRPGDVAKEIRHMTASTYPIPPISIKHAGTLDIARQLLTLNCPTKSTTPSVR